MNDQNYEITFKVNVSISSIDIDKIRKENRNFLTNGFFKKDYRIARVLAYDKAVEVIKIENESMYDYEIKTLGDKVNG